MIIEVIDIDKGVTWCEAVDCSYFKAGFCTKDSKTISRKGCKDYEADTGR